MRYGPYSVIGMDKQSLMGEAGALWNYPDLAVPKPDEEFSIFALNAGLEYPDGANANIDTGMWLHHMVHFTVGPSRSDVTCLQSPRSMPHYNVGATPQNSERSFSSGNERTRLDFTKAMGNGTSMAGYHIMAQDKFAMIVDLMNMNMEEKSVYLTMTYDYVMGFPSTWENVKPVWFDADQCGTSEVDAPQQDGHFVVPTEPYVANFDGEVMLMAGHLHDGGYKSVIKVDDKDICTSTAKYAESKEFVSPEGGMDMSGMKGAMKLAKNHISSMTVCNKPGFPSGLGQFKTGQTWLLDGHYNYTQYPGDLNEDNSQAHIMSIAIMYVKVPRDGAKVVGL
ncbi:hypothetical protein K402DRAFT_116356 [Aulographum hederae CBS 113979]|uniref:Uncharacterized protein n=1 Tax=Aulographum hederae CBS 113979 TaxID=1176131 RepID=A0A6G1GVM8_9PEZI|nr:hypothetical protein K402DRAFT_116356 [Aulographum hederae CBS 113979]